jgi:hypothetical protein
MNVFSFFQPFTTSELISFSHPIRSSSYVKASLLVLLNSKNYERISLNQLHFQSRYFVSGVQNYIFFSHQTNIFSFFQKNISLQLLFPLSHCITYSKNGTAKIARVLLSTKFFGGFVDKWLDFWQLISTREWLRSNGLATRCL